VNFGEGARAGRSVALSSIGPSGRRRRSGTYHSCWALLGTAPASRLSGHAGGDYRRPARRPGRQRWAVSLVGAHNCEAYGSPRPGRTAFSTAHIAGELQSRRSTKSDHHPMGSGRPHPSAIALPAAKGASSFATATASPRCAGSGLAVRAHPATYLGRFRLGARP
jgi:hypothetical protein